MNGYIKNVILAAVLFGATAASAEVAQSGSCMSKAIALRASQKVTLVNEYDPELKDFYDMGVCYYKITLRKGTAYTIWLSGGNSADMMMSVDVDWQQENSPFAMFDYMDYASGDKVAFMYADAWDEDDPTSFVYYVAISGEIGDTCQLYYQTGIKSFTQVGEEDNPRRITVSDTQVNDSRNLIAGDYYYIVRLEAGRKYMFRTTGGTSESPLAMSIDPFDYMQEDIPDFAGDKNNMSWYVYPSVTQDYVINVSGGWDETTSFKLKYKSFPARLPGAHETVKLRESDNYTAEIVPGRTVGDVTYYDSIIDETLCRISLRAGEKWVFETSGAVRSLKMAVYDVNGNVLGENTSLGNGSYDCRIAITTTYDGWYYVGVCRPELEYWHERPEDGAVTLTAYPATSVEPPDEFDPADDTYDGAELIDTYPATAGVSVPDVGSTSEAHALNAGDWYDWFCFAGRSGTTYALKASYASLEMSSLKLGARVYKLVDGSLKKVTGTLTTISPESAEVDATPLAFTADANAMYYVRVSVSDGVGLDYPEYRIHAVAYIEGVDLGLVQVKTKGVDATWYITDASTALYPNGATVALPADQKKNIRFTEVGGYSTPAKTSATPVAWDGGSGGVLVVQGVYNDQYDTADDVESGFVTITPSVNTAKAKRTLWTEDEVDWFRFKVVAGRYYNFYLTDTTQDGVGDAVFAIKYYTDESYVVSGATEYLKKTFDPKAKGKYNLCVYHGTPEKADTSYRLYYQAVNVGTVRFATTTPNVSESADYVDVVVQRTASEGAVRVNYATEAFTAQPGKEYYPASGVLEWADGDMADKTIRVRLIPDMIEEWDAQLRFKIRLWPMSEDALADDEYPATIENDTATVKIKEISAKQPGTIAVVGDGANTTVTAGDKVTLGIDRIGGSDGKVAVKVYTQPGTAVASTDYEHVEKVLVWEDGDTDEKLFTIATRKTGSVSSKQFNIKFAVQTAGEYADCATPSLASKKVYLTILSDEVSRSYEETVALAKTSGVKMSATGTWYTDVTLGGRLRCAPPNGTSIKMNFSVTEPGFFIVKPVIEGGKGLLRYMTTTQGWVECTDGSRLAIPVETAGGTTISFKLSGSDTGAYVYFEPQADGQAFTFIPLSAIEASLPDNKAVVDAESVATLAWSCPAEWAGEGLWYRVRIGDVKAKSSRITTVLEDGTKDTSCTVPGGTLASGKTYWWMLDFACSNEETPSPDSLTWITGTSIWSFTTASAGAPSTIVKKGYYDAYGDAIVTGERIKLAQGVPVTFYVGSDGEDATSCSLLDGALPDGLSLYQTGKVAKIGRITGTPVAAGEYSAIVQVVNASGAAKTLRLDFDVYGLGTAVGSFTAALVEDGDALSSGYPKVGRITGLTVAGTGAASATVKIAGVKYSFSAAALDAIDEDDPSYSLVTLAGTTTIDGVAYENRMELKLFAGDAGDPADLFVSAGSVKLTLNVSDEGIVKEVTYRGELVRDNSASKPWLAVASRFAGYYTVSLVPYGVSPYDGVPCGNGYLTLTLDETGTAKYAGLLADGTAISGSSRIALRGDIADPANCEALVPFGLYSSPWSLGGVLKLHWAEDADGYVATVVDSGSALEWNKDGAKSSFDGDGFRIELRPTGGWYNTLVNLQTYYLNCDFSIEAQAVDGLPAEMLPADKDYTADTMPHGVNATLGRSTLTPDARKLVTKEGSALYDLAASVNPWKVKTAFVPATGLVSGTFRAWSDSATQSQFATLNHYGVLLMNRDAKSPLDDDVWTAGFYLVPVTSDWTFSLPFNIISVEVDRDWNELEPPVAE